MNTHSFARLWLITLVSVSLLAVRVSGVHLHLCRDGQEPPATVHISDAGDHDDHHTPADEPHADLDVLLDDGLAKTAKSLFDLPSLAGPAAAPYVLVALQGAVWTQDRRTISRTVSRLLRPPSRGPPL